MDSIRRVRPRAKRTLAGTVPVLLAVVALLAACSSAASPTPAVPASPTGPVGSPSPAPAGPVAEPAELTVYGAASLKDALAALEAAYETAHPEIRLTISTDSSAALATKITEGAPADVFLSADTANPQKLVDGGYASAEPTVFAGNKLTVIVPGGNPGGIATPADLAKPGLKIVAAGDEVPVSRYAWKLVANLAELYPAGFAVRYASNVVSKEDSVKGIVAKIELGEGDAGIVYVTDAAASSKVETVPVPDTANVTATYAGVVIKASAQQEAARAFLDWVAGPDGQAILAGFGFLPPP
jgi:molybdate transport system substrate-binding protein